MQPADAASRIATGLDRRVARDPDLHAAMLLVHSPSRALDCVTAAGEVGGMPTVPDQPYHAASVGKTFTATLVAKLVDAGMLAFDDPIAVYLPPELLDGLHVYRGRDRTGDIRVDHLLSHTSGLPHLLGEEYGLIGRKREQDEDGRTFFDVMLEDPDRFWDGVETVEWAKQHLSPHFAPGEGVYYSEVGYNLLGLLIEEVTGRPYGRALHEHLFDPLGMDHSYLLQYTEPAVVSPYPVANIHVGDEALSVGAHRSFSGWYAGGQTVNTTADLLAFHRALVSGQLVEPKTLERMHRWRRLYMGVDSGYGVVRVRPLPLLRRYRMWGGLGATSSFMFYAPALDVYLIGTFNQWEYMAKAMRFVFKTLRTASKVQPRLGLDAVSIPLID